jgi:hypothetical protein
MKAGEKIREKNPGALFKIPTLTVVSHDPQTRVVVVEDNPTGVTHWFDWYFETVKE